MRRQRHRIRTAIRARKERLDEQRASQERREQEQPASLTARVVDTVEQAAEALPHMVREGAARLKDEVVDIAKAAEAKVADLTRQEGSDAAGHA
jgi:hypothetical protein